MIDRLLKIIAPHHCYNCKKIGTLLCDNCKYDIISEPFERCISCLSLRSGNSGVCKQCSTPYIRSWVVGERHDVLEQLLNGYKFSFERESGVILAGLLDAILPQLPEETIITYVPTIPQHIRQRGYDHARLLAKEFAKQRKLRFRSALVRQTVTKQLGASRAQRIAQAKVAFKEGVTVKKAPYLLIDDIFTTGSTMTYATKTLLTAGASEVVIAVIARQTLD